MSLNVLPIKLIKYGPFRGSSRMGGKKASLLKSVTHRTMMKLVSYTLPKEDPKNINHMTHSLSSDIKLLECCYQHFLPEINNFCHTKK